LKGTAKHEEVPTRAQLQAALAAAQRAHHEFEQNALGGTRDEQWPGWYAAYVLGRLGDFATPSTLARWLEQAPLEGDWSAGAARYVLDRIR
jgi:hypothetical protein